MSPRRSWTAALALAWAFLVTPVLAIAANTSPEPVTTSATTAPESGTTAATTAPVTASATTAPKHVTTAATTPRESAATAAATAPKPGTTGSTARPRSVAPARKASTSAPAARPAPAASDARATAPAGPAEATARGHAAGPRTLEDIHIEGEIPVPQVLFITTRDQRRFVGFQHRRYQRTSRKIGEDTAVPSRILVTGAATLPERSHSDD